ncbi:MAG: hypothetical protein AAGJ93_07125 [Bacteroidota bacterium]
MTKPLKIDVSGAFEEHEVYFLMTIGISKVNQTLSSNEVLDIA